MANVSLSALIATNNFEDTFQTISGATYAITAIDHKQTRLINQSTDMVVTFAPTLQHGLLFALWRRLSSAGQVSWAPDAGATVVTIPDGGTSIELGGLVSCFVNNPSGAAAEVVLLGSMR
jgi:hypothetical protein